jgi:modulator of FtsH protease
MNQPLNTADTFGGSISSAQRNKVLRNTYWLLAISLLPTVAGAWHDGPGLVLRWCFRLHLRH